MWTCPACGRSFKSTNQQHGCVLIDKETLFVKRPPGLKKLYGLIKKQVDKIGEYREETVLPDVIYFKTKSTFLAIKVKKDHLVVEFFLEKLEDAPPVFKYLQTSKNRVVHMVAVDEVDEIDEQLVNWIKRSYELVSG
jgi:predicted transport protein